MDEEQHTRNQFQVDRLAFFSDAVIAIAITLLVLEIKVPALGKNVVWKEMASNYGDAIFRHLIALFVSFYAVGNLWMRHHELFEHVKKYNKRLIKTNLYFLFTVILLPLAIAFNFEENNPESLKVFFILLNLALCNFFFYLMVSIIANKNNLFYEAAARQTILDLKKVTLYTTIALLAATALSLVSIKWFYVPFVLLWLNRMIGKWRHKRKQSVPKKANVTA